MRFCSIFLMVGSKLKMSSEIKPPLKLNMDFTNNIQGKVVWNLNEIFELYGIHGKKSLATGKQLYIVPKILRSILICKYWTLCATPLQIFRSSIKYLSNVQGILKHWIHTNERPFLLIFLILPIISNDKTIFHWNCLYCDEKFRSLALKYINSYINFSFHLSNNLCSTRIMFYKQRFLGVI